MDLYEKIVFLRKEKMITQEKLADMLGITRQAVSRWESGLSYPETDKIKKMAEIFDVSLEYLLNDQIISKEKRSQMTRIQNYKLAILIITLSTILGMFISICLAYIKQSTYWGLLPFVITIFASVIAYAVCRNRFLILSDYNNVDEKLNLKNTTIIYRTIITCIMAFFPLMVHKETYYLEGLEIYGMLLFGNYLSYAMVYGAIGFGVSYGIIEQIHYKKKLNQVYRFCPILYAMEILIVIVTTVLFARNDGVVLLVGGILIIILFFVVCPIWFHSLKVFRTSNMIFSFLFIFIMSIVISFFLGNSEDGKLFVILGFALFGTFVLLMVLKDLTKDRKKIMWWEKNVILSIAAIILLNVVSEVNTRIAFGALICSGAIVLNYVLEKMNYFEKKNEKVESSI